jgi:hypothetical protein
MSAILGFEPGTGTSGFSPQRHRGTKSGNQSGRVHGGKHRAHREMPQKGTERNHHPAGEFKFVDHCTISISPFTPSELGVLCDEIELRNLRL